MSAEKRMAKTPRTTAPTAVLVAMMMFTGLQTVRTMDTCETRSAICIFNGRLRGTILLREKQGFGCSSFGNNPELSLDIDLQGFDPRDRVTAYNFRVKSFAGMVPNCRGMDPDFKADSRTSDLGTYTKTSAESLQLPDLLVQNGPTLWGDNSVLGRSVAVTRGGSNTVQSPEVVDCCIIGTVSLNSPPDVNNAPSIPNRVDNTPSNINSFGNNPFPTSSSSSPGTSSSAGGRPFPGTGTPSFGGSSFKSPFDLDSKLGFFDLSGKTSRVHNFSPDSVEERFKAPEPPRFQDIYGLDSGDSPLGRSGYGNTVRSSRGSSLSRLFFQDEGLQDALSVGLTAEEMDIPRESEDEESSTSFLEDKAVDQDPGYVDDSGIVVGQDDVYQGDPPNALEDSSPGDPLPSDGQDGDSLPSSSNEDGGPDQASLLPSEEVGDDRSVSNPRDERDSEELKPQDFYPKTPKAGEDADDGQGVGADSYGASPLAGGDNPELAGDAVES